jgi:hypothetical protein
LQFFWVALESLLLEFFSSPKEDPYRFIFEKNFSDGMSDVQTKTLVRNLANKGFIRDNIVRVRINKLKICGLIRIY